MLEEAATASPTQPPNPEFMDLVNGFTITEIIEVCKPITKLSRSSKRKHGSLHEALTQLPAEQQAQITRILHERDNRKRRRFTSPVRSTMEHVADETHPAVQLDENGVSTEFMESIDAEVVKERIRRYIQRTSNAALAMVSCACCAREVFRNDAIATPMAHIPHQHVLRPTKPHDAYTLYKNMLLHRLAYDNNGDGWICLECWNSLESGKKPALSLANGMWIGEIPFELGILTLPERILIAKYFPAAYVVKLYPKAKNSRSWDQSRMQSGLKGNVSTYHLNVQDIACIVTAGIMPPPAWILAATIGVTFISPCGKPEPTLPDFLRVRRRRVREALQCCKRINPLYADIQISEENLAQLPVDGIPEELVVTAKVSDDMALLAAEHGNYVPQDEGKCLSFFFEGLVSWNTRL